MVDTEMRVILMCAGDSLRASPFHKLLYQIKGETIINRQIRMLQEAGVSDVWITFNADRPIISKHVDSRIGRIETHDDHKNNFFGFKETIPFWNGNTLVLVGDLVYSEKALRFMLEKEAGCITVFGIPDNEKTSWCGHPEIFGIKILTLNMSETKRKMECIASKITNGNHGLWNIPLELNLPVERVEECRDIDDTRQYQQAQKLPL